MKDIKILQKIFLNYPAKGVVLSIVFRKFVSDKMKLRTGIPVMERLRTA